MAFLFDLNFILIYNNQYFRRDELNMANLNVKRAFCALALTGTMALCTFAFTGCDAVVYDDNIESVYDVIDSQGENVKILPQVLEVPGEDFKLIVEYSLDEDSSKKWTITDNKKLFTKVYTEGLPEGVKVYIDNIHTDTSIVATRETMNGILQDTMDDRIHNSLMYGFPISDDTCFYGVNVIEGQNDTFIKGSFHGFNGYSSGSVEEKRYTEKKYLENGVYANKISSAYGLLIQKGNDEPYGVDVSSDVVVLAYNKIITEYESGKKEIKTFDRDGGYTVSVIEPETVREKKKVK